MQNQNTEEASEAKTNLIFDLYTLDIVCCNVNHVQIGQFWKKIEIKNYAQMVLNQTIRVRA